MDKEQKMTTMFLTHFWQVFCLLGWCLILLFPSLSYSADDSLCARVKIEIRQEITLERQAFDAHMRINNGLEQLSLEMVRVEVTFLDEHGQTVRATMDPEDTSAIFFFRVSSQENITGIDGTGIVPPSASADIHWLIVPARGAAKANMLHTLYYVGATLSYTLAGDEYSMEVAPDFIFVKPMPTFAVDYFLPAEVIGDDPLTPEAEASVPFSLGVRVSNHGQAIARSFKIDSAQPGIVDNSQGLPLAFKVLGAEVGGREVAASLVVDLGDIVPEESAVARWLMACSCSGRFVEFSAEFSHADELGGTVTSLMDAVNTHVLVREVLADLPGRDRVRDFLARDGGVLRVYESEGQDSEVLDQSTVCSLTPGSQTEHTVSYTLVSPATIGFMLVQLPDPTAGTKPLKEVTRSDGKRIKPENVWLSRTRNGDQSWNNLFNLFDVNSTSSYQVTFADPQSQGQPPVLTPVPDVNGLEGMKLNFTVSAGDPDGTTPILSASPLPALASFTDRGDGTAIFDWTPAIGQAGHYEMSFQASDGIFSSWQRTGLRICTVADTDCDGVADEWEIRYFGTLDRDGLGDFDRDGVSDRDEYLKDTDPTKKNSPSVPLIASPTDRTETTELQPDLTVYNSTDPDGDSITYGFELFADAGMTMPVASEPRLFAGIDTTSWTVPVELNDNAWYRWRVRASDGKGVSEWANGSFFVNTANDPPGQPALNGPSDGSEVDRLNPALSVTAARDVDEDPVTYIFEVYGDENLDSLVASSPDVAEGTAGVVSWTVNTPLNDNTRYWWRVSAVDGHGSATATPASSFFVNTANDAPLPPVIIFPLPGFEIGEPSLELVVENAVDIDGDELTYTFELDTVNTFSNPARNISGSLPEGAAETRWTVSALSDNTHYYFRVRAGDGAAESLWVSGSFFVNRANDPPSLPTVRNPGQGAWVQSLTPTLELAAAEDVDADPVSYEFELYESGDLSSLIARSILAEPRWVVPFELANDVWYWWRAQAVDEHGAASGWVSASFFTDSNGVNDPPEIVLKAPAATLYSRGDPVLISWDDLDPDSNAEISLTSSSDETASALAIANLPEDPDGPDDTFLWDTADLAEGTYLISAIITDGLSSMTSTARGGVVVDRTAPTVAAAPGGGSYNAPQSVALSASETAIIYYSIDGSDPSPSSPQYGSPLSIATATTLKFMAVDRANNASPVATARYDFQDSDWKAIIAAGDNRPVNATDRARFSLAYFNTSRPWGILTYSFQGRVKTAQGNRRLSLNLISTSTTTVSVSANRAVIVGTGRMGGSPCFFTASLSDASPDAFGMVITDSRGKLVFSTSPAPLIRGRIDIRR